MSKMPQPAATSAFSLLEGSFGLERHMADTMSAAHWHDHVEINLLLNGHMTYLLNGRQERVEAGRLVLFWAAIPHRTVDVAAEAPLVCAYLPLVDFLGLPVSRQIKQSVMQGRLLIPGEADPLDIPIVSRWVDEWSKGDAARRHLVAEEVKLRVRRLILDTVDAPIPAASQQGGASTSQTLVHRVEALTELINTHYTEALSIAKLASLVGMHASTANKMFVQVLGMTVKEYLIRYRLAQAMHRLADTDQPILQIAHDCGFGSGSRFYDVFKHRLGVTPRAYRLRMSGERSMSPDEME